MLPVGRCLAGTAAEQCNSGGVPAFPNIPTAPTVAISAHFPFEMSSVALSSFGLAVEIQPPLNGFLVPLGQIRAQIKRSVGALTCAIFRSKINICLPWCQMQKPHLALIDVIRPVR